ncbi:LamG-like jellyroll fold domain-containing protein [Parafilimonas sp.]|uniref:LamG-like jellyroll fold domain-containing protein n=1 Tax=Parafilimonas sp. TaxID=1969739 RepID=UPI003F7F9F53
MAYYPFNGNANDASGNDNNPVFNNTTLVTDYYGNANSACQFNGIDTYIKIANSNTLNMGNTISVCAWIKPTGFYYGTCHGNSVLVKGDDDFITGNYMLRFDDGMFTGTNCGGGVPDTVHQTYYGIGTGLSPVQDTPYAQKNIWRSVVYTYDGLHARLYIDCNLVLDSEQPGLTFSNGNDLVFGRLNNIQFPYWLNATLDEVRIYNRALNSDEVKAYSFSCADKQPCSNWLKINKDISGVQIDDLDVSGNKLTVEALINRTTAYPELYDGGDVVSKHDNRGDANYLLRPTVAQITTSNGFFETKRACPIELNKTYHIAMVYDGKTLKFYRNGFLMDEVPASGNLHQNNWLTKIGTTANAASPYPADFIGYINEVRVWKVARSQADIKQYMNRSLPNPAAQTGLLAYYTFDDLKNKQGNAKWNGKIIGDAKINQTNPECASFIADSCNVKPVKVVANFTGPDTVCINNPVQFSNLSAGASNYYWSFCTAGFNTTPLAKNIGNPGNLLKTPVFMDYEKDANGNFYGFISNYENGHIVRLDYGNSLLNTPTPADLGNFNGLIPIYAEGIQVKEFNGKCYVFVVAAGDDAGNKSTLIRLDFGSSFANSPTVNDLGNIGGLLYPHDLFIASENNYFYGFTINIRNNTITRFDFGSDLGNTPSGVNLGNIGNFNYPCGLSFLNTNDNWYAFVVNRDNNSITRLDFGNSITNLPNGINIGNPGSFLNRPRDISIFQSCDGVIGLVVNEEDETTGSITKLDFGNNVSSSPQAINLGNIGSLKFPHSISKFFLEGNDIYSFITNVVGNTITRLRYTGCTSTDITSSTKRTPPPVTYTTPGTYNVNLLVDIGLPTQTSFCKQVVVINCDTLCSLKADFKYVQESCNPKSIYFQNTTLNADSIWWDFGNGITAGNVADTLINYASFGNYLVKQFAKTNKGCLDTTEYTVNVGVLKDDAIINNDTSICSGDSVQLNAVSGLDYCWSPAAGLSNTSIKNPVANPFVTTKYYLHVLTDSSKPVLMDSVIITVLPLPDIKVSDDTIVCGNALVQLNANGASSYAWNPSAGLSNTIIANPIATVSSTTTFVATGTANNSCSAQDSVTITVNPIPVFAVNPQDTSVCLGDSIKFTATGGDVFKWFPDENISDPLLPDPIIYPTFNATYNVIVTNSACKVSDTLSANIVVNEIPKVTLTKSNDVDCLTPQAVLRAEGGIQYTWEPATFISNIYINNPVVSPPADTWYAVNVKDQNGCKSKDSILVKSSFAVGASPFQVPGAFTPNNDGLNDCFSLKNWGPVDFFDILIYDRWGYLVFHSNNINACWDGTVKGAPQGAGTFVYQVKVSSKCTEGVVMKKGTLVLIR